MPTTIEKTVYSFDELSDTAKERARTHWRDGALDYYWWEAIEVDAREVAAILGIDIHGWNPNNKSAKGFYFSGFSSQGDGACFEGNYSYSKGWREKLKAHAPKDKELLRIGLALSKAQRPSFYLCSATIKHSGFYNHSGCMQIDVDCIDGSATQEQEEAVEQALRDFADWIYKQLEMEYEYQMSDECVDKIIKYNEVQFDENGRIA